MMEFVMLDLDDTILDFHKAEAVAISKTIGDFGVEPTQAVLDLYHNINRWHWQQLELGKMTRDQVLVNRFAALFDRLGQKADPAACARRYEGNLSQGHYVLPGAREVLEQLQGKYRLFLASNGTAAVQHSRLRDADLYRYFEKVFISQEVGFNKPSREFFTCCFAGMPGFSPEKTVMVGDSLTSDIQGGINAGITTIWVSDREAPEGGVKPDYRIETITQLPRLLERL